MLTDSALGRGRGCNPRVDCCEVRFLQAAPNINGVSVIKTCKCGSEYKVESKSQKKCRPCKQSYDRAYHAKRTPENKDRKLKLQKDRMHKARQFIWDYFSSHECVMCGETDPIVLEFDHIDQTTKSGNISEMLCSSIENIQEEINKCRVLCANCHRRHTAAQLGWYKNIQSVA